MKELLKGVTIVIVLALSLSLTQSCDGLTSTEGSGDQATIDAAGVATGLEEVGAFVEICRPASGQSVAAGPPRMERPPALLNRLLEIRRAGSALGVGRMGLDLATQPADQLGDCGGRATYVSYEHSNGTTAAVYEYQDYCLTDSETGNRTTLDGRISYVETGTPGNYGPIISKLEAESPNGVRETTRTSGGQLVSSREITFEDFEQTYGVPGGDPTPSSPDRLTFSDFTSSDLQDGKTYRQSDFSATDYFTPSGGEQTTFSGRGYRSNGNYYTYSTPSPISTDSDGIFTGGVIAFSGADNSSAVVTVVPGSVLQGTLTVNGEPVTDVPVCR